MRFRKSGDGLIRNKWASYLIYSPLIYLWAMDFCISCINYKFVYSAWQEDEYQSTIMKKWLKSDIAQFLLKVVGIYILWYIIYDLWLLPDGRLDKWLVLNVIDVSSSLLSGMGYDVYWTGRLIGLENTAGILLVNGCSGISAIGLFIGFVIAYPGRWIPRISFILVGIGVIYLVNILRIIVLVITQQFYPAIFDITHDYSTTAIFYLVIFVLWMIWVNLGGKDFSTDKNEG